MPSLFRDRIRKLMLVMKKPKNIRVIMIVLATVFFICMGYEDLQVYNPLPRSEVIRNYGLLVVALWGGFLAVWRSQIAESGLRNDRFQRAVEMLGGKETAMRLGGIYALGRVAQDHPENYLDQVIGILSAFVRYPAHDEEFVEPEELKPRDKMWFWATFFREDVQEAVGVISNLNSNEIVKHHTPDLRQSDFANMYLANMNLSGIRFDGAQMRNADLTDCDLTGASLIGADLTSAQLVNSTCRNTKFTDANFTYTDISSTDFCKAIGLTQEQLDQACHSPNCPPILPSGVSMDHEAAVARWEELNDEEG